MSKERFGGLPFIPDGLPYPPDDLHDLPLTPQEEIDKNNAWNRRNAKWGFVAAPIVGILVARKFGIFAGIAAWWVVAAGSTGEV